ncbi:hypothetical protein PYH66_13730 (plasmid) [Staphylococcus delphini]|uniref:hypothetical protein n=1 Tax=Staphylococcus delphini TaxID=53344 RepID=UPI003365094B
MQKEKEHNMLLGLKLAKEKLNESQRRLRSSINRKLKEEKISYIEIKEVLHLVDREQQLKASLRR